MSYHFDPMRVVQATAVLLSNAKTHKHNYTAILKMLYLADRKSILKTGSPITGDRPYAMKLGPVLSNTLNLINSQAGDEEAKAIWSRYFMTTGYNIELVTDPGDGELSDFEVETLKGVFEECGDKGFMEIVDETHNFQEWKESYVQGTSSEIHLKTLLKALGMEDQYDELSNRQIEDAHLAKMFGGCWVHDWGCVAFKIYDSF